MPSAEVIDFATLVAPIAGDNPAGVDLRADPSPKSLYYAVKDARSAARAAERQLVYEGEETATKPDWSAVLKNGVTALSEKTKDLEIAAYLVEALVRLHGFAGLRDGFRLVRELVEQYWDALFPQPDEEGMEGRVASLTGLNGEEGEGTLISPIAQVLVTEGSNAGPFAYFHYQQAVSLGQLQDEESRQNRIAQGAVTLDLFTKAVAETPGEFFVCLVDDLNQCLEEFSRLNGALEERCGSQAPPSSNIRTVLSACLETVTTVARDKLAVAAPAAEEGGQLVVSEGAANGVVVGGTPGAIRTRDDAFALLLKVAEFFHRTEPHTPVSYALEQVVRWGRMSLPDLLTELIPEESSRLVFFKQVGIQPVPPPE